MSRRQRGDLAEAVVLGNKRQYRTLFQGTATPAKWFTQWKWTAFLVTQGTAFLATQGTAFLATQGTRSWDALVGCGRGMQSWEYCAQALAVGGRGGKAPGVGFRESAKLE